MKIYLVRHGESTGNAHNLHQTGLSPLSKKGIKQAQELAIRFKDISIDKVITSSFERAKQTAEIVNRETDKPLEVSELFIERKRPTEIEGLIYDDPNAVFIKNQIKTNYHNPEFKHSDEETFFEMKNRAEKALTFLENQNEENILVVTHGDFLICLMGVIIFGNNLEAKSNLKFGETFISNNTGITVFEHIDRWRIRTWNDHAHLGDLNTA